MAQRQPLRVFLKKDALKNFTDKTRKTPSLFRNIFLLKRLYKNFIKKGLRHRCFAVNFGEFLRTRSFMDYLRARGSDKCFYL